MSETITQPTTTEQPESPRGFLSAPVPGDLKPTEREAFLLETIRRWHETSAESAAVLAQPLGCSYSLE